MYILPFLHINALQMSVSVVLVENRILTRHFVSIATEIY